MSGVPNILYYLPERSGGIECKCVVQNQHIEEMEQNLQLEETGESDIYQEYFNYVITNENLCLPLTAAEAFELFQKIMVFA